MFPQQCDDFRAASLATFRAAYLTAFLTTLGHGFFVLGTGRSFSRFLGSKKHTETSIQQRSGWKQQRSCSDYYTSFVAGEPTEKAEQRPSGTEAALVEANRQPHT